jgi:hypothetical protein
MQTSNEENKNVLRRFWEAMNTRQLGLLDDILTSDAIRHCQATPDLNIRSCEQFKEFCRQDTTIFPDSLQTITYLLAEGNFVAVWAAYEQQFWASEKVEEPRGIKVGSYCA